jgi:hypothetical protein
MHSLKNIFLILVFVQSSIGALIAQEIVVNVKKGTAKIGETLLNSNTRSATLRNTDVLDAQAGALIIARQETLVIELPAGKKYSYNDIQSIMRQKKAATQGGLSSVAFKDPVLKTNPTPLKGSNTRGTDERFASDFFYPFDDMLVIEDKIDFYVGNPNTKIINNVVVRNIKTGTVYYNDIPQNNFFQLSGLPAGDYEWTYKIEYYSITEKEQSEFVNTFKVVRKKDIKAANKKISVYRNELKGFSPELQKILLLEYYIDNNIYTSLEN